MVLKASLLCQSRIDLGWTCAQVLAVIIRVSIHDILFLDLPELRSPSNIKSLDSIRTLTVWDFASCTGLDVLLMMMMQTSMRLVLCRLIREAESVQMHQTRIFGQLYRISHVECYAEEICTGSPDKLRSHHWKHFTVWRQNIYSEISSVPFGGRGRPLPS